MHSSKNLTLPQSSPLLSVIVPMRNEATMLPQLFATLNRQDGIDFELLLVDGGSSDNSPDIARVLASSSPFSCRILSSTPGRGAQMNAGAAAAQGDFFLFLHADSAFIRNDALNRAMAALRQVITLSGHDSVAGHFALRFARNDLSTNFAFNFHEAKARCHRPGCIHGDQGFLLSRQFFAQVGPFNTTLPFLEDDRLAARVFALGEWQPLPAQIVTSARRFACEGLQARRTLNALILTLDALGRNDILSALPELYRAQEQTQRIDLLPFFLRINDIIKMLPSIERRGLWHDAGSYLWGNRWQLLLLLRVWLGMVRPGACGQRESAELPLVNLLGSRACALAIRVWFWTKTCGSTKKTGG